MNFLVRDLVVAKVELWGISGVLDKLVDVGCADEPVVLHFLHLIQALLHVTNALSFGNYGGDL